MTGIQLQKRQSNLNPIAAGIQHGRSTDARNSLAGSERFHGQR
jgi:hypothetical protein